MTSKKLWHAWRHLQWQQKVTAKPGWIQYHSVRTFGQPKHSPYFAHTAGTKLLPRLVSAVRVLSSSQDHSSRPAGYGFQRPQSRLVSTVSPSENQHNPVSSENILRNPVSDIHIPPELSLHQMVFDICDKYKDKLAVVRSFFLQQKVSLRSAYTFFF